MANTNTIPERIAKRVYGLQLALDDSMPSSFPEGLAWTLDQIPSPDPHDTTISKRKWEAAVGELRQKRRVEVLRAGASFIKVTAEDEEILSQVRGVTKCAEKVRNEIREIRNFNVLKPNQAVAELEAELEAVVAEILEMRKLIRAPVCEPTEPMSVDWPQDMEMEMMVHVPMVLYREPEAYTYMYVPNPWEPMYCYC